MKKFKNKAVTRLTKKQMMNCRGGAAPADPCKDGCNNNYGSGDDLDWCLAQCDEIE